MLTYKRGPVTHHAALTPAPEVRIARAALRDIPTAQVHSSSVTRSHREYGTCWYHDGTSWKSTTALHNPLSSAMISSTNSWPALRAFQLTTENRPGLGAARDWCQLLNAARISEGRKVSPKLFVISASRVVH